MIMNELIAGMVLGFALGYLFYGFLKDRACEATKPERERVLDYIKKHGSITSKEAKTIGVNNLRSLVCRMKKDGERIYNVNKIGLAGKYVIK